MKLFTKKNIPAKTEIDFLKPSHAFISPRQQVSPKGKWFKKTLIYATIFILISVVGFTTQIVISGSEATKSFGGLGILSQLKNFLLKSKNDLAGIKEDRINIALLGIGGEGHPGPYLTDTIIILSLRPGEKTATLMSVPRDLYVSTQNSNGGTKINTVYAYGAMKKASGGSLVKEALSELFGVPIHYYVRIDFSGFIELIDTLDGIDIYVEQAFVDPLFPAKNFTTRTVSFKQGPQHFDSTTALQFARSRHGTNGESGDFARARRQQQVLLAIKAALLKKGFKKPHKISKLIDILGTSIETDMEMWEAAKLTETFDEISEEDITRFVLTDNSQDGLLSPVTGSDGAFLLIPKDKELLKLFAQNIFDLPSVKDEYPRVILKNGTEISGFAHTIKTQLEQNGFTVLKAENAQKQSYSKTVVYDLTTGKKSASLRYLRNTLNANISKAIPPEIWQENMEADFVIILGESGNEKLKAESDELNASPSVTF